MKKKSGTTKELFLCSIRKIACLTCVVVSLTPSLYQETVGEGLPAAEHSKLILPEFLKKEKIVEKQYKYWVILR